MKLEINITRQDYSEFNKFHFIQTKLKRTVISGLVMIVAVQLILNRERFNLTATIISSVICALVYVLLIVRSLNKTKNIPDKSGTILGEREIELTDANINFRTLNSHGTTEWSSIKNMKESSKAFYLYLDTNVAILIPKRVFKDSDDIDVFKKLVSRKIQTSQGSITV